MRILLSPLTLGWVSYLIWASLSVTVWAHGSHGDHEGPNGGFIITSDVGVYEVVHNPDYVEIYVSDLEGNPALTPDKEYVTLQINGDSAMPVISEYVSPNILRISVAPDAPLKPLVLRLTKKNILYDIIRIEFP